MAHESLGLIGYDSYSFVVENLERSREFYRTRFDFREAARSSQLLTARTGEIASVLAAGDVRVHLVSPVSPSSAAGRFLRRHPAGVRSLNLRVTSAERARALLVERGATLLGDDLDARDEHGGRYRSFSIASPLGDVAIGFVERADYEPFAPGFEPAPQDSSPTNRFGFEKIDHVTCNLRTVKPAIDWLRSVLGLQAVHESSFHSEDVSPGRTAGAGLRTVVVRDPESGLTFACNEPLAPFFESSQVARFLYDNQGAGVAYVALAVPELAATVAELRRRRVEFLPTPAAYYRALPERLEKLKITRLAADDLATLEKLEILVDGRDDRYLLQIFARESSGLYDDERGAPFFYELVERAGDDGFGHGNFRALLESIEREQSRERAR